MRTIDIFKRAGRSLRQAKTRTILTSLAIGVGAFTIALAMAAGNGGRAYIDNMVSALGSTQNLDVSAVQPTRDDDSKPKKINEKASADSGGVNKLSNNDVKKIQQIDGVEKVFPMINVVASSASANGSDKYEAIVQAQSDDSSIEIVAGELGDSYTIPRGGIVLPHKYLESFNFKSANEAIGKIVTINFNAADGSEFSREFKIVAVDKDPSSILAFYQDQFRISNADGEEIANLQSPKGADQGYYGLMVTAKKGVNVDEVKTRITEAGDYRVQTFAEMRGSAMQAINLVQYGLIGFGLLAIIASVFGIINTQYISVLERTQQIGLMKALGMRRKDVSKLFRYEAAWIGFLGGVIGIILAYLVTLLNPVINNILKLEEGTQLLIMDWLMCTVLVVGLVIVAVISGFFPSRKAAKLDPIEALRTE